MYLNYHGSITIPGFLFDYYSGGLLMKAKHSSRSIERNVAMELVRVTEAAAMSAARFFGKGDKNLVDQAAVEAMRYVLGYIRMDGIVVIGEGEKDEAPMLYIGERIGAGSDL